MQHQYSEQVHYTSENDPYERNNINEDLIKLRQMNEAFTKMNEQHMYTGHEYYSYEPHVMGQLHSFQGRDVVSVHQSLQQRESQEVTERSNSLLLTLSEKDEEQTRPTTNVQHLQYEYDNSGKLFQTDHTNNKNSNRFGSYEYHNGSSMTVNNTLVNNVFYPEQNFHNPHNFNSYTEQVYYLNNNNNDSQRYHQQQQSTNHKQQQPQYYQIQNEHKQLSTPSSGFSKYEQFAIKISKLFNIQVEDLEIIYNQLKFQKEAEIYTHGSQRSGQCLQNVEISDSEVMKKLFSYALEVKNSHNKLKNMITTIDHRKNSKILNEKSESNSKQNHKERPHSHIPQKNEIQNISINFMLEQQQQNYHKLTQMHQSNQTNHQKDDQTQRIPPNKHQREDSQNIESKKTIIQKLVGQKGNLNSELISQQTLLSHSSFADSNITNTKTNKSRKNSRVTEKIKLISQQLESLKKEIDNEDEGQLNTLEADNNQQKHIANQFYNSQQKYTQVHQHTQINTQALSHEQSSQPPLEYHLPNMTREISQYVINVNKSQNPTPQKVLPTKQPQIHTFGGESFTYAKAIQQIPMEDPEIDLKIQQTIKTCIVKSPSKKIIAHQQQNLQSSKIIQRTINRALQQQRSQKIIVEQGQTSNSRSKYSFKQNSQSSSKDNNETMITSPTKSQNRQQMFKSIAEMKKNLSKQKTHQTQTHQWSRSKTTNNAYLETEDHQEKTQQASLFPKNVFQNNIPIKQDKKSETFQRPKFFTKQVMRDGKLVFEKSQVLQSQHKIRQPNDEHTKTATFGTKSPVNTEKLIKIHENFQSNLPNPTKYNPPHFLSNNQLPTYHSDIPQPLQNPVNSQPTSNTLLEAYERNRKPLSLGIPSSLYSARTIESRPFIESETNLPKPSFRGPVYVKPPHYNFAEKQKYQYVPKMIKVAQNVNNNFPSNPIFYQSSQIQQPQKNAVFYQKPLEVVRPLTPQKLHQVFRPVTPIQKIQNMNIQVANNGKPRSFSVQRIQGGRNGKLEQNHIVRNQIMSNRPSQIRILPQSESQNNIIFRPNIVSSPVNGRKVMQRAFSVPIKSMTPERNIAINFRQTLIEKPKVNQGTLAQANIQRVIKRQLPQTPVVAKHFELKPQIEHRAQQRILPKQPYNYSPVVMSKAEQKQKGFPQQRHLQGSVKERIQSQPPRELYHQINPQLNNSKSLNQQIEQSPQVIPNYSPPQQQMHPRLQESEMYYGQVRASTKHLLNQMPTNYKQMNLMSSRREDSVVHTFPVQLDQSTKMNNSIYAREQFANGEGIRNTNKPTYGQIVTYQQPTSPKTLLSPQNLSTRIPNSFRPPKYIAPKQPILIQQSRHINNQPNPNLNKSLQKSSHQPQLSQSSRPPIKTYTMGHLLDASRTQKYMQESISEDRKSNTALNASNVNGRVNDLYDSTPSFGRIQDENGSQSLVISPFSKQLNSLNQSRNSSASKRSSSSRSRSNKKGIALESKRNRIPSHQFLQSSYHH